MIFFLDDVQGMKTPAVNNARVKNAKTGGVKAGVVSCFEHPDPYVQARFVSCGFILLNDAVGYRTVK